MSAILSSSHSTGVLAGAIAASLVGGLFVGFVCGLILRPMLDHRRLSPAHEDNQEKWQQQRRTSPITPTLPSRAVGYIPPSPNRIRDSLPVFQIRPDDKIIRQPPRTLQLVQGQDRRHSTQRDEIARSVPSSSLVATCVDRPRVLPSPSRLLERRFAAMSSSIEYVSSPSTPAARLLASETDTQRQRASSTPQVLPLKLRVQREELTPHPWSPSRRTADGNHRLQTADSEDSSRFIPHPVRLHPLDDSDVDETDTMGRTTPLRSQDGGLVNTGDNADVERVIKGAMHGQPESLSAGAAIIMATAPVKQNSSDEQHKYPPSSVPILSKHSRQASQASSTSTTFDRSKSPISPQLPPAWQYDGDSYWQRRGALQQSDGSRYSTTASTSPSHSSSNPQGGEAGQGSEAGRRNSRKRPQQQQQQATLITSSSSSSLVAGPPLLLFLPPASSSSSSSLRSSYLTRGNSTFARSSEGTWYDEPDGPSSFKGMGTSQEGSETRDNSLDGILDEMLMAAPVGDPEWRAVAVPSPSTTTITTASNATVTMTMNLNTITRERATSSASEIRLQSYLTSRQEQQEHTRDRGWENSDDPDSPRDAVAEESESGDDDDQHHHHQQQQRQDENADDERLQISSTSGAAVATCPSDSTTTRLTKRWAAGQIQIPLSIPKPISISKLDVPLLLPTSPSRRPSTSPAEGPPRIHPSVLTPPSLFGINGGTGADIELESGRR